MDASVGRGAIMMAASPSAAGSLSLSGIGGRKSEEIADLIDVFSKMQYRAKEVTPGVRLLSLAVVCPTRHVHLVCVHVCIMYPVARC